MLTCIKRRREWLGAPRGTLGPRDVARSRRVDLQTWTKSNAARLCTPFRIQYDLPDLDPTTWLTHLSYKGSPFKPTSPARPSFWYLHHTCMLHSKYFHTHCLYFFPKSVFFHTPNYPFNTWLVFHFPRSENVFFISLGRILILLVMSVILMEKKIIYNIFLINRSFSHVLIFELYY